MTYSKGKRSAISRVGERQLIDEKISNVYTYGANVLAEQEKVPPLPARRVGVREFRGNFSGFIRQVRHGSLFIMTSRDKVIAIIQPPQPPLPPRRQPGTLRGKIRMMPDFDTVPPAVLDAMEGKED